MFYDRPLHLGLLAGPDYSTALVSVTNPELVTRAEKTLAPHGDIHGYTTIKDIMDALNPLTGQDLPRGPGVDPGGAHHVHAHVRQVPAPLARIVPGGMSTTITTVDVQRVLRPAGQDHRLVQGHLPHLGRPRGLLPRGQPRLRAGRRPSHQPGPDRHLGQLRRSTTPPTPTATSGATSAGPRPAMIIEGKLVTTKLTDINMGFEEFIEHSFYDDWTKTGPQQLPHRPPGQPPVAVPPVEQDHPPQAHGHQLQGEVHLGHRSPLGPPGHRDRRLRPACGPRPWPRRLRREPLLRAHRRRHAHAPAPPRPARDRAVLAPAPHPVRPRAQPGPGLRHGLHRHHRHELPAQGVRVLAPGRDQGPHPVQDPQGRAHRRWASGRPAGAGWSTT